MKLNIGFTNVVHLFLDLRASIRRISILLNPLSPNSDKHLISPYSITT